MSLTQRRFMPVSLHHALHVLLLTSLLSYVAHAQPLKGLGFSVYTFGDSLTDTGNAFKYTKGKFPETRAYPSRRFTNAPGTWADILKLAGAQVVDNAYGGATACFNPDFGGKQSEVPAMNQAVDSWLAKRPQGKKVVVLFGGHNDLLSALQLPTLAEQLAAPGNAVKCLLAMAGKILTADPEATVMVGTLAPFPLTPLLRRITATELVEAALNKGLSLGVGVLKLRYGRNRVHLWDINAAMTAEIQNYARAGFKFGNQQACLPYRLTLLGTSFSNLTLSATTPCNNPNQHVFYDPIHPSSRVHLNVAKLFISRLLEVGFLSKPPANYSAALDNLWAGKRAGR